VSARTVCSGLSLGLCLAAAGPAWSATGAPLATPAVATHQTSTAGAPAAPASPCAPSWPGRSPGLGGTTAYDQGEYIAQDYIFDDHGANTGEPIALVGDSDTTPAGSYTYPGVVDQSKYVNNAADLRELRMRVEGDSLAIRVELNSLTQPDTTVAAVALDTDGSRTGSMAWPHQAGLTTAGTDAVVTLWGTGADLYRRDQATPVDLAGACANVDANVLEVRVPLAALGVSTGQWRVHVATGLWDSSAKTWMAIGPVATETSPGGSPNGSTPRAFDIGFVPGEGSGPIGATAINWYDAKQAAALAAGDINQYAGDVDLGLLRSGASRPWVMQPGLYEAIYHSSTTLGPHHESWQLDGPFEGPFQPYSLYIPTAATKGPVGLFEYFHGVTRNHTQLIAGPNERVQLGERLGLALVHILGRGGNGGASDSGSSIAKGYRNAGLLDSREALADAQSRLTIDRSRQYVGGYSLGGIGVREMLGFFPDQWAGAVMYAGTKPANSDQWLASARWVPLVLIHAVTDEVVTYTQSSMTADALKAYGYMYELHSHPGDHEHQALTDDYTQPADFFENLRAPTNPARVTLRRDPAAIDDPALGIVADSAYWLSKVTTATAGTVDLVSHALPGAAPTLTPVGPTVVNGPPDPYLNQGQHYTWPGTPYPRANSLTGSLTSIDYALVDSRRAGLDLARPISLTITTDGPSALGITGCTAAHSTTGEAGLVRRGSITDVTFPRAGTYDVTLSGCSLAAADAPSTSVPEAPLPAVLPLLGFAAAGLVLARRRSVSRRGRRPTSS